MHIIENEVAQLYPTLCDPVDCSPPGSSVHGILQARILEWVAIEADPKETEAWNRINIKNSNSNKLSHIKGK